jgi:hypothetical protein
MQRTFLLLTAFIAAGAQAAPDADALLAESDRARGGHLPGLAWTIEIASHDSDGDTRQTMAAITRDTDTRVDYTAPEKMRGQFVILLGRNMWFSRPGLQKAVPISPRQRLIGQAANGDIAATNYRDDYHARLGGEEPVGGEPCAVLELNAKARNVTYDRIRYWVSIARRVGVKAEFYTVSGKLFKTATFDYGNAIEHEGHAYPFVSRMLIVDAINRQNRTLMSYSGVQVQCPDRSRFELSQ